MAISPSVINKIKWVMFRKTEPPSTHGILWAKPVGEKFVFHVYDDGTWQDIAGTDGIVIPELSVNISAFNNDVGYLTALDLSGYSTTEEMNAAIAAALQDKQDTLVSGTNIKTINNQSILGSGNITIQGGGSSVQSDWNQTDTEADDYIKNKPTIPAEQVQSDWNQTNNSSKDFIKNKPTIPTVPTNVSAFTNDAGYLTQHQSLSDYVQKSQTAGLIKNDGTIDTNTYLTQHQDISGKQDTLVSGTTIKTINNESVLGSGNISVTAELPSNLAYTSNDNGEGIIPQDGIRAVTVTSGATMTISPDVVTVINGAVGTSAITLQVPNDNLAHVWDILMTTDSSVAITFSMSNSATILYPNGFSVGASKAVEVSVIGKGSKYYLRYGEFA